MQGRINKMAKRMDSLEGRGGGDITPRAARQLGAFIRNLYIAADKPRFF
jgi:hypothetical protein